MPGLEAKPILDIVAADDQVAIDDIVSRPCADGRYAYDGDRREGRGLLFVRGDGAVRLVHVHVVGESSRARPSYLQFHPRLIDDVEARTARYRSAQRELAPPHAG